MQNLLTVKQVAEFLGVGQSTIRWWITKGVIPFCRVGRRVRFDPVQIRYWIGRNSYPPPARQRTLLESSPILFESEGKNG